ncbi:MAG: AAA family ATPase [Solirubrobacterales bacterium]|nr:AAA family ATPase [Solirubrobacterales bacterium]
MSWRELEEPFVRSVLVRTKLLVPALRPGMVSRPNLVALLERGRLRKLTLVCAPTGWGKTSLLAQWALTAAGAQFAWLSVDRGDDEPLRFWRYFVAALATVEPAAAEDAQRRLAGPAVSIADEVLPALLNDLAALEQDLVLVLDDFHLLGSPQISAQLVYLLDHLPPSAHVAIATQTEPLLRLGRVRALGDLVELRGDLLRFSEQEAAALLNGTQGLELAPEEVLSLQRRTEGWVAGLNLAAMSLKQGNTHGRGLDAVLTDERLLTDYLWDEVVLGQPPAVRQFLMRTAILERLTGSLCDAVAQGSDSAEVLRELERANLFVVALDPGREWFRYHQLFRNLLVRQLRRFAPDLIPDLHRRASHWFADRGFLVEAIEHGIAAGDMHWAADELERHWLAFYSSGQATTVIGWIDRLPNEAIEAHPVLALVRAGIGRALGRFEEVEPWLARAEQAPGDAPAPGMASTLASGVALVRSMYRLGLGDVSGAVDWGRRALALEPVEGSSERATAGYFLGVALFYRDPQQAEPLLREYLRVVPAGEQDVRRYFAIALLAEAHALRGELEAADRLADDAFAVARAGGLMEHPPTEEVHAARGAVLLATGRLESAEQQFERSILLARRGGDKLECAHALVWLARLRARQGDRAGGRSALDEARRLLRELDGSSLRSLLDLAWRELGETDDRAELSPSDESLTEAELRVLRLLPTDLSYREIAREMYVSLNTVRTHAQHIRRKLGASSRADSVARARQLDLL